MLAWLYFASILLTGTVAAALAYHAWQQPAVAGSRAYAALALAGCVLALAEILSMLSPTQGQALFWFHVRYPALAVMAVCWLLFALTYSGRLRVISRRMVVGLFAVPVATQALLWTNGWHGLWVKHDVAFYRHGSFWIADVASRQPGVGFLLHAFYALNLTLIATALVFLVAWRIRRQLLAQGILLSCAGVIAFVVAAILSFNVIQTRYNLLTPGMGVSVFLIALAAFRFDILRRAPAAQAGSPLAAADDQTQRSLAVFLFAFVVMSAGIATIGYLSYQDYEKQFRAQVENQLSSIATLKVGGLMNWRAERVADAETVRSNSHFVALAKRWLENPEDAETQASLQSWLDALRTRPQYDRIFLLDVDGNERLSSPTSFDANVSHLAQDAAAALVSGQVTLVDFHRHTADGSVRLVLLAPLLAEPHGRPVGALGLRIDPNVYLYPYLKEWPVASASAETLLVRREGTEVVFLNELRFREGSALNLRMSLDRTELPAAKAVLGVTGVVEGRDYRGVPVVADVRPVPGSPWFLVTRVDAAEVYAPLHERLQQMAAFFALLIASAGLTLTLLWRQQSLRYYRDQAALAETLRASEERYRTVADYTYAWEYWQSPDDKILYMSPSCQRITGYSADEFIADPGLLSAIVLPEDRASLAEHEGTASQPDQHGAIHAAEFRIVRRDGTVRWIGHTCQPIHRADGTDLGRRATNRDITERKQAEEALRAAQAQLQSILDSIAEGLQVIGFDWCYVYLNAAAVRQARLPREALIGHSMMELYPGIESTKLFTVLRMCMKERKPYRMENEFVYPDGTKGWFDLSIQPVNDGLLIFSQDITERKKAEQRVFATQEELRRMLVESDRARRALLSVVEDQQKAESEIRRLNEELEQRVAERTAELQTAVKELEAFSYSVSHDLRAPLRAIDGFSRILIEEHAAALEPEVQRYLAAVRRNAQQMDRLITDMLALARLSRQPLVKQLIDPATIVRDALEDLQPELEGRQVEIVIGDLPPCQADGRLLRQVFVNLLSNALKFTRTREIAHVEVGGRREGEQCVYYVTDNGVGFDMQYADKLFGLFQRLHRADEYEGTGVGLAIVQRIVHRHGGRVWAEAEVNKGASFYFTI